jgi:hypothetical protein
MDAHVRYVCLNFDLYSITRQILQSSPGFSFCRACQDRNLHYRFALNADLMQTFHVVGAVEKIDDSVPS